jgi:DNA-directed RNA polymerase beta' subunit
LDKDKLKQEGRSVYSIVQLLESKFKNRIIVQYSDEWSKECYLQIRNLFEFGGTKFVAEESASYILSNVIINGFQEIRKVFIKKIDGEYTIATDGSNLKAAFMHPLIDRKRSYTNCIPETNMVLGIQAAKKLIENELQLVLSSFSIHVEARHLNLIADIMTHNGTIMPLTRFGLNGMQTGVLTKASFEQTKEVIKDAARYGFCENLKGSAACIMVGNPPLMGTGIVELYPNISMLEKALDYGDEKLSAELAERLWNKLEQIKNEQIDSANAKITKHKALFKINEEDFGADDMIDE